MANVLATTRYVKPGAYVGRIIQPSPLQQAFIRTPVYVAKGSRYQVLYNVAMRRAYLSDVEIFFSSTAPNIAPLTNPALNDQTIAVLYRANGTPIPVTKWSFLESVPGSGVYDQILIRPEVFDANEDYRIDYQSTDRSVLDVLPFSDLRELRYIGDTENQEQYQEQTSQTSPGDFLVPVSVVIPTRPTGMADPDNKYPGPAPTSTGFTTVTHTGIGTGVVTVSGTYDHSYNRTVTLRVASIDLVANEVTFDWEQVQNSAGTYTDLLPNVPLEQTMTPPQAVVGETAAVSLAFDYPGTGTTDLGISLQVDTAANFAVGDLYQFTAMGPGMFELDSAYANTDQYSDLQIANYPEPGSTGNVVIYDYTEYTGTINRKYALRCTGVSGTAVAADRIANFVWQGYGDDGVVTTGTITVDETVATSMHPTLEHGVRLTFSFGVTHFTPEDDAVVTALAPRDQPVSKDDRTYDIQITSVGEGSLGMFYSGSTQEARFGVINITKTTGTYVWSSTINYTYNVPTIGGFTIPGDFRLYARNIGEALPENRYSASSPQDKFEFSSVDSLSVSWNLRSRSTETFALDQIYTDVLGTITGVPGRQYVIMDNLPFSTTSLLSVTSYPTGTSLAHELILDGNGDPTPYVAFPVAPTESVRIYYEWRGPEPGPGQIYYVTANILRPDDLYDVPIVTYNDEDMRRLLGPSATDNDALIMGEIAYEVGVPRCAFVQPKDTDADGVYTKTDFDRAILATEKNKTLTDVVIINKFDTLSTQLSSNERMNDPFERADRMLWVGAPIGTAIGDNQTPGTLAYLAQTTMQVYGENPAHGRRVLLGNVRAGKTIQLGDGSTTQVILDGSFVAGATAAYNATFTDPAETLLRKTLPAFDFIDCYQEDEELRIGAASILYLHDVGSGVYRFDESVTVDRSSTDNNEINVQNQVIYVTYDLRNRMENALVGFVPDSEQAGVAMVQGTLVGILVGYVGDGTIAAYTNADGSNRPISPAQDTAVFRDTTDKTLYHFKYWYNSRVTLKRLFGLFSVDKKLWSVTP